MKKGTIGIIGAMDIEIEKLVSSVENPQTKTIGGIAFTSGKMFGKDVVIAKSGMGKVFAAVCAQTMILGYSPVCIINSGIAGSTDSRLGMLDITIGEKVVQHDYDFTPLGKPLGYVPDLDKTFFECDGEICNMLCDAVKSIGKNALRAVIATGDQFIADKEKGRQLHDIFGASACEMEGGAIGQVCTIWGIPFGILRTISDGGDESSSEIIHQFGKLAADQAANIMKEFVRKA